MAQTHSYLKVDIYSTPAWEAGSTFVETLTKTTSSDVSFSRGLSPHTARFELKNDGTECDYAGKGVVISAYCNEDGSETTKEVFRGFIIERRKILDVKSLTHTGWRFVCEDVMATWEAYEYDIDLFGENGLSAGDVLPASNLLPPNFVACGGTFTGLIRNFKCTGNAMALFAELRKQDGHVSSACGDLDSLSDSDNITILSETEAVPECEGISLTYKKNNNSGSDAEIIKTIFMAKSQQWWVPIAWSIEEDDDTYTIHIIYQTTIQHSKIAVSSADTYPYNALYFDDTEQAFSVIPETSFVSETATVADYDYTLLGDISLIQPEESTIFTNILIHKSYTFATIPESEEKTGASLIVQFKKELPDIMSLHINSSAASPKSEELQIGSAPYQEEDLGYIRHVDSRDYFYGGESMTLPKTVGDYGLERLAEMQFTDEKSYAYTFSLVSKVPIPAHGTDHGTELLTVVAGVQTITASIVENTSLSWSGDGIQVSTTIRSKSEKTAAYKRISSYNLPRYFKKKMTTKIDKLSEADYARIEGDFIIFNIDGEEVKISLTDNILTDDGIVRW